MMRIMQVVTRGDVIGGAQTHIADLSSSLVDDGHEVIVVVGSTGVFTDRLARLGIQWKELSCLRHELSLINDVQAVLGLRRWIRRYDPDIVACHSSKAGIVGRLAAKLASVPCLFTAHGWAFTEGVSGRKRFVYKQFERLMSSLATRIICVSDYDRTLAIDAGIDADKLVTIHNGIPDLSRSISHKSMVASLKVIMTGRFAQQKRQSALIHAATVLPELQVHFVGDGPELSSAQALATRLKVEDRCVFHGYQADVAPILEQCDVFCLTSNYEGFPISTLEAMRAGLPTIVSEVGGAGEAVEDGISGFVVERGDHRALASRLKYLQCNETKRFEMGQAARTRYLEMFHFEKMYQRTLAEYRGARWRPRIGSEADS